LVMGGSQGARILNQTMPKVAGLLGDRVTIWHQAGKGAQAETERAYREQTELPHNVTEFIDDVAAAYAWADIVVCRSGALTVSELSAAGVGAIFVPFMHKDRQQALNADHLVQCGAAVMIEQPDLTVEGLAAELEQRDRAQLEAMAQAARDAAIIDADRRVADVIKSLAKH
ncbi:UDP-N-acetylglucosamine--N-acetylmuramyl-(pentapeptide) pyrophosphoryl-undecaprenol N-acetylglucosamine transferase, partial [Photobacterium aphoticum]